MSSLVIAGTKPKARKGAKTRENEWEKHRTETESERAKTKAKKGARKGGDMTKKR